MKAFNDEGCVHEHFRIQVLVKLAFIMILEINTSVNNKSNIELFKIGNESPRIFLKKNL